MTPATIARIREAHRKIDGVTAYTLDLDIPIDALDCQRIREARDLLREVLRDLNMAQR